MFKEVVTITKKEYEELLEKSRKYDALRDWGVDNWSGYSDAMQNYYKDYSEE
jgi:hypothetical protein